MHKIIILFATILLSSLCQAQELEVIDFRPDHFDQTASTDPLKDNNGNVCALIKLETPNADIKFEGNVVKSIFNTNEYWVYISPESLRMNVICPNRKKLIVDFTPYVGRKGLAARQTYILTIGGFSNDYSNNIPQIVTITHNPTDAIVIIDGNIIDSNNGLAEITLPSGKEYSFIVTARGYATQEGSFKHKPTSPTRLNIQLYPQELENTSIALPQANSSDSNTINEEEILANAEKAYDDEHYQLAMELYLQIPNNAIAQNHIGQIYKNGYGIEQNYTAAVAWFRKAAEQGYGLAQGNLGWMYLDGKGVETNLTIAAELFTNAAEQGDANIQYDLGILYEYGLLDEVNYTAAVKWYRKAAEQGLADAQFVLGNMYEDGKGVPKDINEAIKWYRLAANQGQKGAKNRLGL